MSLAGKALLSARHLYKGSVKQTIRTILAQWYDLPRILKANPISASEGPVEIHMLLNHARALEGLWAIYSLASKSHCHCRIILHDDGTLTNRDRACLSKILLGCRIIDREIADRQVETFFRKENLDLCLLFRKRHIFALKLFDPFFFAKNKSFILLDSDVLFFSYPTELIEALVSEQGAGTLPNLYLQDPNPAYYYCLPQEAMRTLCGKEPIPKFNPGVLRVHRDVPNWERINHYLSREFFGLNEPSVNYYSELTIWAMELAHYNSKPLSHNYGFVYSPGLKKEEAVCLHYCGGPVNNSFFYTDGLPWLSRTFRL